MDSAKKILLKILETIDYSDDREKFADEFIKNVHLQSLLDLISTLPTDKQEEIKTKLSANANDSNKITSLVSTYFSQQQMQDALETSAKKAVTKYIETIDHTLSTIQRQQLADTFQGLRTTASA